MFRLVKWAYNLGVKHERKRIDMAISELSSRLIQEGNIHHYDLAKETSKERKDELIENIRIAEKAQNIISQAYTGGERLVPGPSIMKPSIKEVGGLGKWLD